MMLYIPYVLLIFLITGLHFAYVASKSDNPDVRLRAKFLFIAIISFTTGALLDSVIGALLTEKLIIAYERPQDNWV